MPLLSLALLAIRIVEGRNLPTHKAKKIGKRRIILISSNARIGEYRVNEVKAKQSFILIVKTSLCLSAS